MPIVGQFGSLAGLGSLILPGGAMESIATITVGSGGASSIEFTSIPGGFQHLQIRLIGRVASANNLMIRFNGDTSSTSYIYHYLEANGVSVAAGSPGGATSAGTVGVLSGDTNVFAASIVDILDYGSTSKNKVARVFYGFDRNGSNTWMGHLSNLWMNSSNAITSISLYVPSANVAQHTTAALYGLRAP